MTNTFPPEATFETSLTFVDENFRLFMLSTQSGLIARVALMLTRSEAEEVVQEAYLKLYTFLNQDKKHNRTDNYSDYKPLLFSIARQQAITRIRHNQLVQKHCLDAQLGALHQDQKYSGSPEKNLLIQDEHRLLESAISSLPKICRQIFVDRKINGKTYKEIASDHGICEKTVENHIARGLKLCRQFMVNKQLETSKNDMQTNSSTVNTNNDKYMKGRLS